jgi:FSR family fosmidomycin resistance protein-like MFS transporter
MLAKTKWLRGTALFVAVLYGVELLDELIYGLDGAALPYLKTDFALTYTQVGLLFTLPGLVGVMIEPVMGLLGDTRHRRALVMGGIIATAIGLLLIASAHVYGVLLLAFGIMYVASGAYVNLSQATLIDRDPQRAEQTMARWTLLGSIGVAFSPLIVTAVFSIGYSWRSVYVAYALIAVAFIALLFKQKFNSHAGAHDEAISIRQLGRNLIEALRNRQMLKWIILTELADFMLDKLLEVTGLYFHDVAGVSLAGASAAVAVFTIAGLIGNGLIVSALEKVRGLRVLRLSSIVVLIAYAAMLLIPIVWIKYVLIAVISFSTSGWFAILRAKCFEVLPGQSGVVIAVTSLANISSLFVPVIIGSIADAIGLPAAMWLLAIGPVALIIGVR